jgi:hypothetical protein
MSRRLMADSDGAGNAQRILAIYRHTGPPNASFFKWLPQDFRRTA